MSLCLACVCAASPRAIPAPPRVAAAFARDGFSVVAALAYGGGVGVSAESAPNVTINGDPNKRKPAYFVSGTGFEMGYLVGALATPRVEALTSTFIDHIVPALISEELDSWLQNSTLAPVYDALCAALATLLEHDSARYFAASVAAGAIPAALVDELRGLAAGAAAVMPNTSATFERLATVNFGYDMLLALIYSGEILDLLAARAASAGAAPAVVAALRALPPRALRPPVLCNAFAARGARVAGATTIFGRDFMFALGEVFQLHVATTVYSPTDGRAPLVAVAAPGFVGAMVALNAHGFAMGVDVLQAALANTSVVGLNSLLMVRAAAHAATDVPAAAAFVAAAQRGVPWLYPMADASGAAAMLETAPSPNATAGAEPPDWRPLVEDAARRAALPSPAQIAAALAAPVDYDRGVFARRMGVHARPEQKLIPAYNPPLFALAKEQYPPPAAWAPGGAVFANYTDEAAAYSRGLNQCYFSPERLADDDLLFATNLALSPHLRVAACPFWTSLDGMGSPQWRYDTLVREVLAAAPLTIASAQYALSFQKRTPGYERDTVDGVMSVCDLGARVLTAKGGYWVDGWTTVTLPAYI